MTHSDESYLEYLGRLDIDFGLDESHLQDAQYLKERLREISKMDSRVNVSDELVRKFQELSPRYHTKTLPSGLVQRSYQYKSGPQTRYTVVGHRGAFSLENALKKYRSMKFGL